MAAGCECVCVCIKWSANPCLSLKVERGAKGGSLQSGAEHGEVSQSALSEMAVFPALKSFVKNKIFYYIISQFQLSPLLGSRVVYFQKFRNILLLTICLNSWTYWTSTPGPNICGPRAPSSHQCCTSGTIQISATSLITALWAHKNKLPFLTQSPSSSVNANTKLTCQTRMCLGLRENASLYPEFVEMCRGDFLAVAFGALSLCS